MTNEELTILIRDWFLNHKGHYAGWSEYEADIDMCVDFVELADLIIINLITKGT